MTDDLRWAVRYAFLEDLWRDRARVIVDAGLEATLRAGASRPGRAADDPLGDLVDALVPRAPGARTWVGVADEAVARELAQTRPATGFLPRASVADVVAHRDWAVAFVELAALHDDAPDGARLREQLAARAEEGRTVVIAARATPIAADDDGVDPGYAALADLLEDELGGGRIYGLYRPPMAAIVDFGAGEDDEGDGDDEVPLSFDNTLGSQSPQFIEYLGVTGEVPELAVGMTLVELPPETGAVAGDDGLRSQLVQAQRQVELAAIDRQALLEKVDQLESGQAEMEQQLAGLRDRLARAITESPPEAAEAHDRLQAVLADNQALRWKAQQLDRELEAAKARPVQELEAEVAELRARLEAATEGETDTGTVIVRHASVPTLDEDEEELDEEELDEEELDEEELDGSGLAAEDLGIFVPEADERARRIRQGATLRQLERLIERVERGGIGALPLRQALVSLRRRLRS